MTVRTYTKLHLIVYLAIFTVCIVTLKAILHKSTSEPRRRNESPNLEIEISDFRVEEQSVDFEEQTEVSLIDTGFVKELPFYRARLDRRRLIKIYDWVWTGERWDELLSSFSICLSTQGSMDRIMSVPELVEAWRGPVSLAVYITNPNEWVGLNLLVNHYRKCHPLFRDYVSIHLAIPVQIENTWTADLQQLEDEEEAEKFVTSFTNLPCTTSDKVLQHMIKKIQANEDSKLLMENYPQNHMRNIAEKACGTEWTFSTDIDIIPRPDSATLLQDFILTDYVQECQQCAFVVPTFELDIKQSYPASKKELVQLWNSSLAQPFHFDVFLKAHNATNYKRWARTNLGEEPIKVSHKATRKYMQYYEPFYISPSNIPEFQERFIGYGFTRSSQTQEALTEGWKFQVLTPVFAIHWGLQNRETLINPGNEKIIRRRQTFFNRRIFKRFMIELELRRKLKQEANYEEKHGTTPDFSKY